MDFKFTFTLDTKNFQSEAKAALIAELLPGLKRFGAFVRKTAQNSIRKKPIGVPSEPGTPIHGHGAQTFKKNIIFQVSASEGSVIIGPKLLPRTARFKIPVLHEIGGSDRKGIFEPRPYMVPAFLKEIAKIRQAME